LKATIIILAAGILSLCFTDLIRKFALKKSLMDLPNDRSLHQKPIPRLGGVAILTVWFPSIYLFYFFNYIEKELFYALFCGLPLAVISLIDDIKTINPQLRLIIHLISALGAFYFLGFLRPFYTFNIPLYYSLLSYPVTIVGMVWFINLFNFMDGVDGFASVEAIYISVILYIYSGNLISVLFIACIAGFLFWNWPRAKIFLGDTGSTQLGFVLIVMGIYFHNNLDLSILNWIMIAAPFWFDATFTLYKRWRNKEKLNKAHKKHAYQRLIQYGFSHRRVLFILILLDSLIFLMILIYREYNFLKIPLTIFTILVIFTLYKKVDKLVPFKK
jgi:Fuc2NAc and GlcNAc transferase